MVPFVVGVVLLLLIAIGFFYRPNFRKSFAPATPMPAAWRSLLGKHIKYYQRLSAADQKLFEYKLMEFLNNCTITGVETEVEDLDKILIGASAVIPIFGFPEWKYKNLKEIILYPSSFNHSFETKGNDRPILGMVGTGYMEDKMVLSKTALRQGFQNETDKRNTAIHEFIHLIDKMDGSVDGVPRVFLERQYVIPWMDMIERKLEEMAKTKSDINPYAKTGREEFFAVLGEYFFERPYLLRKKHPELYAMLEEIFEQDLAPVRKKKKRR
ncbi:MAG: M90 family metallopeptidase [Bacteroidota bacterium]